MNICGILNLPVRKREEGERTGFVARMWCVAYFSCVEVLARVRTLYSGERLADFERAWSGLVHCGDAVRRMAFLARFTRRMWNASEFMKTLKQSSIDI